MTEAPFKIGHIVRSKLGGQEMEVVAFGPADGVVWCRWKPMNHLGEPVPEAPMQIGWFQGDFLEVAAFRSRSTIVSNEKVSTCPQ